MITLSAAVLHRMAYNCRLYQVGKNSTPSRLTLQTDLWGMSINDGHLYLQDTEVFHGMSPTTESWLISISAEVLKELELELRSKEGNVEVGRNGANDLMVDGVAYEVEDFHGDLDCHDVLGKANWSNLRDRPFAVMGDRFRKFSLIKTPGEFPMDFVQVWHSLLEREMLVFRAGPTVRGALAVLDREFLKEDVASKEYLWHTGDKRVR